MHKHVHYTTLIVNSLYTW